MVRFSKLEDWAKTSPFHVLPPAATTDTSKPLTLVKPKYAIGSPQFHALCAIGGGIACALPHTGVTWLDMVKCRLQVDPSKYRNPIHGWRVSVAEGGLKSLTTGWAPISIGFALQGIAKFGLYESFKIEYSGFVGPESAYKHRTLLFMSAAASAEFWACVLMAPWEAVKVRQQTAGPHALRHAMPQMWKQEGLRGLYKGLPALMARQIPFTAVKFAAYEGVNEVLYRFVVPKPRAACSQPEQLVVTFVSGYIAGIAAVFCGLVFHPPDAILANLHQKPGRTIRSTIKMLGVDGLWRASFPRVFMVGSAPTAIQWVIYESFKMAWQIPRPLNAQMPDSLRQKLAGTDTVKAPPTKLQNQRNFFIVDKSQMFE